MGTFILGTLFVCFYWFELRPSQIKKECYRYTNQYIYTDVYKKMYESCLNKRGLSTLVAV